MKVLAHVPPIYRRFFEPYALKGFYVGFAMEYYRRFNIFIPSTGGVRIADTVRLFTHGNLKLPIPSKDEPLLIAIDDLRTTLQLSGKKILPPEGTTSRKNLLYLHEIFKNCDPRDPPIKPPTPTDVPRVLSQ